MFASLVDVAKAVAAPVLSKALYELAVQAQYGADVLERWAGQLAGTARDAAAPVPPLPEAVQLEQVVGVADLLRLAREQGRAVFTP